MRFKLVESDINEQALGRSDALNRCMNLGTQFISHFKKILDDTSEETKLHHASEMQSWLNSIRVIKRKDTNKVLSVQDIIEWFLTIGSDAITLFPDDINKANLYNDFIDHLIISWDVVSALKNIGLLSEG